MGLSRKQALRRLEGLAPEAERHYQRIIDDPDDPSANHYRTELRAWLEQMDKLADYIGKRSAASWKERITRWKSVLE